jgi:hypothetical protein
VIGAIHNSETPGKSRVQGARFFGRSREEAEATSEPVRALEHRRRLAFPVSRVKVAQQENEIPAERRGETRRINSTTGQSVRKGLA